MSETRPALVAPQSAGRPVPPILEAVLSRPGEFDAEVWHVMNQRDTRLIEDEILHGAGSSKFIYNFRVAGTQVVGISVIGARHLASHYGGLRHRIVSSTRKRGELHVFTTYPSAGVPMQVDAQIIRALADEPDYYSVLVEVEDIKMGGNRIQMEAMESVLGFTTDQDTGEVKTYTKQHYDKIAQSKAYRNAVLALIPQDTQIVWKADMLKLKKDEVITIDVIGQKRDGILRYASRSAIPIERDAVAALTFEQIAGLSDAAKDGQLPAFVNAAEALGVLRRTAAPEPLRAISQANEGQQGQQGQQKQTEAQQTKPTEKPAETQQKPVDERRRPGRQSAAQKEATRQQAEQPHEGAPPAGHPANGDEGQQAQGARAAAPAAPAPAAAPATQAAPVKAQQAAMELPATATGPAQEQPAAEAGRDAPQETATVRNEPEAPAVPPANAEAPARENNVQPLRAAPADGGSASGPETPFDLDKRMADAIISDYRGATTVQEIADLNADPVVQRSMMDINSRNPGLYDKILMARSNRMLQIRGGIQ